MTEIQKVTKDQSINRGFFDRKHPGDLRGDLFRGFRISYNKTISLDFIDKMINIRQDLYKKIYENLHKVQNKDSILEKNLRFRIICYIDDKYKDTDRERLYIELIFDTIRSTKITTLCRFFVHGNNLYIGSDSYALGKVSIIKLLFQVYILLNLIPLLPILFSFFIIPGILALWYLYSTWINFFRALFQGENFWYALRINFPKNISDSSFDIDDSLIFLKSVLPIILVSMKEALRKNDIIEKELEDYLDEMIENFGRQTININTGGGGIFGAIIGGLNNVVNNQSKDIS